jgi:gliding motility-associated-like protein
MNRILLALFSLFAPLALFAQGGSVSITDGYAESCGGAFLDSGGQGGGGYQNNEYFVLTICPDTPGDVVGVDFVNFLLDQSGPQNSWDYLAIYDGDNTGASTLGFYTGDDLQGIFVQASDLNTSGCLTFVFDSNDVGTGSFAGTITCETPCDRPIAIATDDAPENRRICVGDEITFDGSESFAADGFEITEYLWDFADGNTDNSGPVVTHTFNDPGEYVVELYLQDDNGCASTNVVSLQLLVATPPSWSPFPGDQNLCLGEEFCSEVDPESFEVTWSGPEQVYQNDEPLFIEDQVGDSFDSEVNVTGFAPGQTLQNINDLLNINISIEHSFLFDLVVTITCPSGESVILHNQWNLMGGATTGTNGTNLGIPEQEFWDYSWSANPDNATWAETADGAGLTELPEGSYASVEPLEQLVGCDLNGTWTISFADFWGGDDGNLDEWGLEFDPSIIPDVTEFTPDIGEFADSSYWTYPADGPELTFQTDDGNAFCILPEEEGSWPYTFTVFNNHGCSYDSTFIITAELAGQADAGEDVIYCGEGTTLNGGLEGLPTPLCSSSAGDYTHCYGDNANDVFTYCPDNPGDGTTMMDITFNSGTIENFFDELWVYDGADTDAPVLAGPLEGDLSGLQFVATNPDGCLTIQIQSDFTVSCQSGSQTELNYTVGCNLGGPDYVYEWTPAGGLSDPSIPNPELTTSIGQPTTYELMVYPAGRPECFSTDEVTVFPAFNYDVDFEQPACFGPNASIEVFIDDSEGGGPWIIRLIDGGTVVEEIETDGGITLMEGLNPSEYIVEIEGGGCLFEEEVFMTTPPEYQIAIEPSDTTICETGSATLEAVVLDDDPGDMIFIWDDGSIGAERTVSPMDTTSYWVYGTYGEGCLTDTVDATVNVRAPLSITIVTGDTLCLGDSLFLDVTDASGGLPPYNYTWTSDEGDVINEESLWVTPEITGNWCCTITDACETPEAINCLTVVVSEVLDPTFTADTLQGCAPFIVQFEGNATNPEIIQEAIWDFGDGAISSQPHQTANTYDQQGVYDVQYSVTTEDGCFFEYQISDMISILNEPIAGFNFEPQTSVLPNTTVNMNNVSLGSDEFLWVFNETDTLDGDSPEYTFPTLPGVYPVELFAFNAFGCVDSTTRFAFVVEEFEMYVPNAFTPDNDGINELFSFEGIDVDTSDFKIQIFNRWGEIVFESTDFEQGWNGSVQGGGYYAPDGMYIYRIETRSMTTKERKEIVGTVTLIR